MDRKHLSSFYWVGDTQFFKFPFCLCLVILLWLVSYWNALKFIYAIVREYSNIITCNFDLISIRVDFCWVPIDDNFQLTDLQSVFCSCLLALPDLRTVGNICCGILCTEVHSFVDLYQRWQMLSQRKAPWTGQFSGKRIFRKEDSQACFTLRHLSSLDSI